MCVPVIKSHCNILHAASPFLSHGSCVCFTLLNNLVIDFILERAREGEKEEEMERKAREEIFESRESAVGEESQTKLGFYS